MDPVVVDREVRLGRSFARAEDEGDVGKFLGDAAGDVLGGEGVAGDHLVTVAGEFAEHPGIVRRGNALRPFVLDAKLVLGLEERDMDLVDPGLLDWRRKDRCDLELLLRRGRGRTQPQGYEAGGGEADDAAGHASHHTRHVLPPDRNPRAARRRRALWSSRPYGRVGNLSTRSKPGQHPPQMRATPGRRRLAELALSCRLNGQGDGIGVLPAIEVQADVARPAAGASAAVLHGDDTAMLHRAGDAGI